MQFGNIRRRWLSVGQFRALETGSGALILSYKITLTTKGAPE